MPRPAKLVITGEWQVGPVDKRPSGAEVSDVSLINREEQRLHPYDLSLQVLVLLDLPQGLEGTWQLLQLLGYLPG